jgi:hypothetical protein
LPAPKAKTGASRVLQKAHEFRACLACVRSERILQLNRDPLRLSENLAGPVECFLAGTYGLID